MFRHIVGEGLRAVRVMVGRARVAVMVSARARAGLRERACAGLFAHAWKAEGRGESLRGGAGALSGRGAGA